MYSMPRGGKTGNLASNVTVSSANSTNPSFELRPATAAVHAVLHGNDFFSRKYTIFIQVGWVTTQTC